MDENVDLHDTGTYAYLAYSSSHTNRTVVNVCTTVYNWFGRVAVPTLMDVG